MPSKRKRLSVALALSAAFATAVPASAGLTRREIAEAGFHLLPGQALPANAKLHGSAGDVTLADVLAGKPALLVFTDYRCRSLCGVVLDQLAAVLPRVPLVLGRDYNVIAVALDSTQKAADAITFRDQHTQGSALHDAGRFLTEDADTLRRLEASVGLVAPFDAEHRQFAHPAGLVLVDAAGTAQRVMSPFALNPLDLKLALTATGAPAPLALHALSLCYAFDPLSGLYTLRIERVLSVAAAATVALIVGAVVLLLRFERRHPSRRRQPTP